MMTARDRAPRDDLIRMVGTMARPNVYQIEQIRSAFLGDEPNVMIGYPAVFNSWAEIDSHEGRFRERFMPGAFEKTLREHTPAVMYNHGFDNWIGENVLGIPRVLREREGFGLWAEVPLLDTDYNRDRIRPQIEGGALAGQSIRFSVTREDWADGEDGIDERSVREAKLYEFGPVTWPAYEATTVGVRTRAQFDLWRSKTDAVPPSEEGRGTSDEDAATPDEERRDTSAQERWKAMATLARQDTERMRKEHGDGND